MERFKKGDLVVPNEGAKTYWVTNKRMKLACVTNTEVETIRLEVLKHNNYDYVGDSFSVIPEHFDLLNNETLFDMLINGRVTDKEYDEYQKLIAENT